MGKLPNLEYGIKKLFRKLNRSVCGSKGPFITKMTPEIVERINKKFLDAYTQEKAKRIELEKKFAELESKTEKKVKEEELKSLEADMKRFKKPVTRNSIRFKYIPSSKKALSSMPKFYFRDDKTYHPYVNLYGFEVVQDKEGNMGWYPLLTDGGDGKYRGKIIKRLAKAAPNFESIFQKRVGIVHQIKAGKVDSNYDLYNDRLYLYGEKYEDMNKKMVDVVHMDEVEKLNYERNIAELKRQINGAFSIVEESKKRESEYEITLSGLQLENARLKKANDSWSLMAAGLMHQQGLTSKDAIQALLSIQSMLTSSSLRSKQVAELKDALDDLRQAHYQITSESVEDRHRRKAIEDISQSAVLAERLARIPKKQELPAEDEQEEVEELASES